MRAFFVLRRVLHPQWKIVYNKNMDIEVKKQKAFKVTLIGSLVDLGLGVAKVLTGSLFHSQALIMDGFHSLSDLITDGFVLIVSKYSFEHPDEEHPYGHGKFETLGTVVIGIILMGVAVFLALDNLEILLSGEIRKIAGWPTLIVAGASIIGKELIYRYSLRIGKELKSQLLIANAWHSRSDAYSSILVFAGLLCTMAGFPKVDLLMAIGLSFFIGKVGWDFIWRSLKELVDTSLEPETIEQVSHIINNIDGVKGHHNLRSRKVGDKAILDVNIEVSPNISVSEGHEIATWVARSMIEKIENIYDVTVHTDVEDDRGGEQDFIAYDRKLLPLRNIIESRLKELLGEDDFLKIKSISIHYVENQVDLDLFYETGEKPGDTREVEGKIKEYDLIRRVKFYASLS